MKTDAQKTSDLILKAVKQHGPISSPQLAVLLGKNIVTIDFHMRAFYRADPKLVYVSDYNEQDGSGRNARMWTAGNEPDAVPERYVPMSKAQIEKEEDERMRREALAENRIHRDPFIAAFFGEFKGLCSNTLEAVGLGGEVRASQASGDL
jgi:predicted ArsR family transcriptional regulator